MECSLYGILQDQDSLTALHTRLQSLSITSQPIAKRMAVYQTSMGTRSSSMARLEQCLTTGVQRLKNVAAADTTQNSQTSVITCQDVLVKEGNVQDLLASMGYRLNHEYRQSGTQYRQFRTKSDLTVSLYHVDLDGDKWIVQCSAPATSNSELVLAEAEVLRFSEFLGE